MPRLHDSHFRRGYRLRLMTGLAVSLLAVIGVMRFWPASSSELPDVAYSTSGQERVQMRDVQPTRQGRNAPPPPPAPLPPVVRPDEEVLQPFELNLSQNQLTLDRPPPEADRSGAPTSGAHTQQVQVGPRPVRIVEPQYTPEARDENVRASVTIQVLVDPGGHVAEASITERHLLNEEGKPSRRVPKLSYGLEEAALNAARRWQFRPARQDGGAVRSYTTVRLSFGI